MTICSICGGQDFSSRTVLWRELIDAWQLDDVEAAYINEQQGCSCRGCGASLRAIALAEALRDAWSVTVPLRTHVQSHPAMPLRVLDVNGVATLSDVLASWPQYRRADHPAVDLQQLPFADGSFDLVMHSDTLEHVERPVRALEECRRVLAPGGRLCFTVPVVVGRLTRSRAGLPKSWHGNSQTAGDDLLVQSEFGVDTWTLLARAGFARIQMNHVRYPAASAFSAW